MLTFKLHCWLSYCWILRVFMDSIYKFFARYVSWKYFLLICDLYFHYFQLNLERKRERERERKTDVLFHLFFQARTGHLRTPSSVLLTREAVVSRARHRRNYRSFTVRLENTWCASSSSLFQNLFGYFNTFAFPPKCQNLRVNIHMRVVGFDGDGVDANDQIGQRY